MALSKFNVGVKALIIAGLVALLLIPTQMINGLVNERQQRQNEAFNEISSKWAKQQELMGPILTIPYDVKISDSTGKTINKVRCLRHILPENLKIQGKMDPEKRYRGLLEVIVYSSDINLSGFFSSQELKIPNVDINDVYYNEAILSIGVTDLRGISERVVMNWDGAITDFNPGIDNKDNCKSGISCPIKMNFTDINSYNPTFNIKLNLKGSEYLYFTPVGKETNVNINSNWATPSFSGSYLPSKRTINGNGFSAEWKVLHLNRNYPQSWNGNAYQLDESKFGISLIPTIDNYLKTDRSIKYAVLFIGLTFLIFFFLELIEKQYVNPLQYLLVGFALCIFYVLLLSISEHLNFNYAYLIASGMTVALIWWYSNSLLGKKKLALLIAGNLILLYGFIFTIIQLEDFALLMGAFGLFIILTLIMQFSKKIDWKDIAGGEPKQVEEKRFRVNKENIVKSSSNIEVENNTDDNTVETKDNTLQI